MGDECRRCLPPSSPHARGRAGGHGDYIARSSRPSFRSAICSAPKGPSAAIYTSDGQFPCLYLCSNRALPLPYAISRTDRVGCSSAMSEPWSRLINRKRNGIVFAGSSRGACDMDMATIVSRGPSFANWVDGTGGRTEKRRNLYCRYSLCQQMLEAGLAIFSISFPRRKLTHKAHLCTKYRALD